MENDRTRETLPFVYDVVVVGAGPCGLAVAARLKERTPSALFTDEEHDRYHWINRHAKQASIKNKKTGQIKPGKQDKASDTSPSILVLDSSGDGWMTKWNRLFEELEITHLRSPMFFHPDPHDRDGLLAYAHAQGRDCECIEIAGCVGKELSKHQTKKRRKKAGGLAPARPPVTVDERDRKDYFAPPSDLFRKYCSFVAERYGLLEESLIKFAKVDDIDYGMVSALDNTKEMFTVRTNAATYHARSVVLAVGAGNKPTIPAPFPESGCECACHVFQSMADTLPLPSKSRRTNVLVIGGGLTSAQVTDKAIRQGVQQVYHLMRGPMKVKPFDVDLSWMGKFRNHEKAVFWSADSDEERSELVKNARGGGSITPRYQKILQQHQASGRLSLHTNTTVLHQEWNEETKKWKIQTEPALDLPEFDHIYFATGVQSDVSRLDFMKTIMEKHPVECYDGIPALTDDLMWKKDIPLFMTGKFAALRLGPGAGNLEGARTGAERIVWALEDLLHDEETVEESEMKYEQDGLPDLRRYQIGLGSRFESLAIEA
ncbi:hypothetical protein MRB53_037759 [Persea americana]|nr:hypothetical protein MRB53_037759 [Persea americana]